MHYVGAFDMKREENFVKVLSKADKKDFDQASVVWMYIINIFYLKKKVSCSYCCSVPSESNRNGVERIMIIKSWLQDSFNAL